MAEPTKPIRLAYNIGVRKSRLIPGSSYFSVGVAVRDQQYSAAVGHSIPADVSDMANYVPGSAAVMIKLAEEQACATSLADPRPVYATVTSTAREIIAFPFGESGKPPEYRKSVVDVATPLTPGDLDLLVHQLNANSPDYMTFELGQ